MVSDVVSPPSVRVFAALAATRIVLFTLGKLLLILVLVAVLDACSVEALTDMACSCSDFLLDIVLPTASTLLTQLLHILYSFVQALTPTFLHIDFYHIASQFWEAIEPCIPPPPIQFCVLGRGIQCGSQLARRPATEAIHDLAIRLVCHLVDFIRSLGHSYVDGLSTMLSSALFWITLLSCHAFFGLCSTLMLYSFGQSLDDQKLEPIYSINSRLALAYTKLHSLWMLLRQYSIHASTTFTMICVLWPSDILKVLCSRYAAASFGFTPLEGDVCRPDLPYYLYSGLVRLVLDRLVNPAPWAVAVLGSASLFGYTTLVYYSIWCAYIRWKLTLFEDTLRVPNCYVFTALCIHEYTAVVAVIPRCPAVVVDDELERLDIPSLAPQLSSSPPADESTIELAVELQDLDNQDEISPFRGQLFSDYFPDDYYLPQSFLAKYQLAIHFELGAGSNGFVLYARRASDEQHVAVKVVSHAPSSSWWSDHPKYGRVPFDVTVMDQLDHDNIIRMLDVYSDDHYVFIVQELHGEAWFPKCPEQRQRFPDGNRTLSGYLMAHGRMSVKDASYVFSQLVDAVDHLHSKGFVHCDIKPGNILIDADLKIKLIDFGNMIELPMDWDPREGPVIYDPYDGILGTRLYTPTEMLCNDPYIPQGLDVWAMGVTLFQMVTGYRPFRDENSIKKHIINYDLEQLENTAALTKMWPILCRCLEPDPLERITIQTLKEVDGIRPFPVWKVDLSKEEVRMMHRRV